MMACSLITISGVRIGCFIIESLLASSLECFYNQSCIDNLRQYLYPAPFLIVPPLNASLLHSFTPQSTMGEMLDHLMVEQWTNHTSHRSYFDQCRPSECHYSLVGKNSWVIVVAKVTGLVSGLSTTLKLVVPRAVQIIRSRVNRNRVVAASE